MNASMHADDERPLLILVSPMVELTRGYMLESVAKEYRVWAFMEDEPTWERDLLHGNTVVDTLDVNAMIGAARHISADGVLCWDETRILASALLAEERGLPTVPSNVIRTCRDKFATRQVLDRTGASKVLSIAVRDPVEARMAAERIGYPVVLKPRALVGSNGTTLVDSETRLTAAFDDVAGRSMPEVRERFTAPVLIEEYLDGPEISVDSLIWDRSVTPLFIARKDLSYPPNFEEIGHTVDAADPLLGDPALCDALTATHAAVGFTHGWTHTEWRLTSSGPQLVEINARSGGDLIPYLGRLVTRVDAGLVAASLAEGKQPHIRVTPAGVAAIRFLYPPQDTIVKSVRVDHAALPTAVERVKILAKPGQLLRLPPATHVTCRYAFLVVTAPTAAECGAALDAAALAITLIPARYLGKRPQTGTDEFCIGDTRGIANEDTGTSR